MHFWFKHLNIEKEFEVTKTPDGAVCVELDGKASALKVSETESRHFTISHDGKSHDVIVHHDKNECQVWVGGELIRLVIKDEKALRRGLAAGGLTKGSGDVISPMPGKVVSVKVTEGATVKIGDGVVVVEAMKMQNELKATIDGIVKMIKVKEGDSVEGGMVLAVVA